MTTTSKTQPKPSPKHRDVDVVIGDKRKHAGLVSIRNSGRDERGNLIGSNGIKWVIA